MQRIRVVITGLGLVTPIGIGVTEFWRACQEGRPGIQSVQSDGDNSNPLAVAGLVPNFHPRDFMSSGKFDRMDRFSHLALVACKLALEDAGLDLHQAKSSKIGVIFGSSLGGMIVAEEQLETLYSRGPKRVHPKFIPANTLNAAAGEVGIIYGFKGPNLSVCNPYVSGAVALGLAYDIFQLYDLDIILAGGAEAPLSYFTAKSFLKTGLVSSRGMKPFERDRDGFVLGEGSAVLVFERLEHALKRGVPIYAEYAGYGQTHRNSSQDVESLRIAAEQGLEMASVSKREVSYVHAHGTATPEGDVIETQAIKAIFGHQAYEIPISATKAMMGHTIGAAGAIEVATCALAIRYGRVPPTINYENPDPQCDLDYVPNEDRQVDVQVAIANAFGLKGDNVVSILRQVTL